MAQDGFPDLDGAAGVLEFLGKAQPRSTKADGHASGLVVIAVAHRASHRLGTFGDHDVGKALAGCDPVLDRLHHFVDVIIYFRDQAHLSPSGNGRVQRDPAGIASHHFQDQHPVMAGGCGHQLVQGVSGGIHRGLEAKGEVGVREVVVDGFGHSDDRAAKFKKALRNPLRTISANVDDGIDVLMQQTFHEVRAAVHRFPTAIRFLHRPVERAAFVCGAQDCAALHVDSGHGLGGEFHQPHGIQQDTVKGVYTAQYLPLWFALGTFYYCPQHRVQPRTVTSTCGNQQSFFHRLSPNVFIIDYARYPGLANQSR